MMNTIEQRTKWSVLRLIRAQSGVVNWQPIVTFFPKGSIEDDPSIDGMDVVEEMIQLGYVKEIKHDGRVPTYSISEAGSVILEQLDRERSETAGQ